ncbi:hypothetical protein MDAP_000231 [Mitosporidium daphniae]
MSPPSGNNHHYKPIENYGVIGNMHTVALVSRHGASIDFFCYPDFDSPTVFARLLDHAKGGFFEILPSDCAVFHPRLQSIYGCTPRTGQKIRTKQLYLPSSNILVTRFSGKEGISQVTDLMPVKESGAASHPWIIRKLECIRGPVSIDVRICPAFDYARSGHTLYRCDLHNRILFESRFMTMELCWVLQRPSDHEGSICRSHIQHGGRLDCSCSSPTAFSIWKVEDKDKRRPGSMATFTLVEGQSMLFVLRDISNPTERAKVDSPSYTYLLDLIGGTLSFWHSWIAGCTYKGRWREIVHRSALLLKLLTYAPTGAIIAAPTFGLPEEIGGLLNWDYRFTWIRDAAFTVYAFLRIGFKEEAVQFMEFIARRCMEIGTSEGSSSLQVLYDIRGKSPSAMICSYRARSHWYPEQVNPDLENKTPPPLMRSYSPKENSPSSVEFSATLRALYLEDNECEIILPHLDGYCGSKPIRIGNAAYNQTQTDVYGELMDAIYLVDKWARPLSYDYWNVIRRTLIPQVLATWHLPDHGIWELRHGQRHYTYSKVMSWVALDRAIRLAAKRSFPSEAESLWRPARDALFEEVMERSWSKERQAFVQYYGSNDLDASSLVMPLVFFLSPLDPKFLSTLRETLKPTRMGGLTANNLCFRWSFLESSSPVRLPQTLVPLASDDNAAANVDSIVPVVDSIVPVVDSIVPVVDSIVPVVDSTAPVLLENTIDAAMILKNEGTFNLCSFWLVEAMARAGSKAMLNDKHFLDLAVLKFEDIIGYANHLGLFSEEISPSGEALGNFPQAFTHLALISAAFNIDRNLDEQH